MLDRFTCYELCVQSPRHVVALLRAAHGGEAFLLREDFCGTAAVSRRWCAEGAKRGDGSRAIGIDLDPEAISRARQEAQREQAAVGLALHVGDATIKDAPAASAAADIIFVGNFSIGYLHRRADLMRYLRYSRERLSRANAGFGGGIFACDTYGGARAFRLGSIERRHPGRAGEVIHYVWTHAQADPVTGMVENRISFRVERSGEFVQDLPDAFVYHWRLWSIAELREAMLEVGYSSVEVYADADIAPGAPARPVTDARELGEDWTVLVAGRA
ncbi:MAG: methyltransferase domain-containing protein [Phycisphaeraceae bacterium]|nr:methyltransferase domain-containing protein [Phycisphaeraceae bacterium]MCW5754928.1 methyltransferase domain-containing protein [Phycisphaeraceae bacterium]